MIFFSFWVQGVLFSFFALDIQNLFSWRLSEMLSLKFFFIFCIFSTLTGSFQKEVINDVLIFKILGIKWRIWGNHRHQNWFGKDPNKNPDLGKKWLIMDDSQVEPNLSTSSLRSSKKGLVVPHWPVVRWVIRWLCTCSQIVRILLWLVDCEIKAWLFLYVKGRLEDVIDTCFVNNSHCRHHN